MIESKRTANNLVIVVICLSLILVTITAYRAGHHEVRTSVDDCAMVLTRERGPVCR